MAWSLCRPPTTWGKHNTIHTHTHTWHESPSKANLSMDRLSPPSCGALAVIDNSILSHPPSRLVHVVHLQLVQTDRRSRMTAIKYRRILFFMFSNEKQGSHVLCTNLPSRALNAWLWNMRKKTYNKIMLACIWRSFHWYNYRAVIPTLPFHTSKQGSLTLKILRFLIILMCRLTKKKVKVEPWQILAFCQ